MARKLTETLILKRLFVCVCGGGFSISLFDVCLHDIVDHGMEHLSLYHTSHHLFIQDHQVGRLLPSLFAFDILCQILQDPLPHSVPRLSAVSI